jgi:hypothetical protein
MIVLNSPADSRSPQMLPSDAHAEFKLIGVGGTGGMLARPLALFCASLPRSTRLTFIDGDDYDLDRNRSRMFCLAPGNKATAVCDELRPYFVDTRLSLHVVEEYVTPENIGRLIRSGDHVLLCVDNHRSRKLVSDHCQTLDDMALFSVGNDGVGPDSAGVRRHGTFGNVLVYARRGGVDLCPPLTHYHPEIASPADAHPADASCQEQAASAPQLLPTNLQAASLLLSTLWLYLSGSLATSEAVFDIAELTMNPLPLPGPHSPQLAGPPEAARDLVEPSLPSP